VELGLCRNSGFQRANNFVANAHRDDGKRFVVRADEKLTAFMELKSATRAKNHYLSDGKCGQI
jgi:hypothetical protein